MEEIEQGMEFEPRKVMDAIREIKGQGPGAIDRITEEEVMPFIEDVKTLATSMTNLYQEHAAHFIALGVRVHIMVEVMGKPAFKGQVGASIFDDHDPNIVEKGEGNAATSV